MCSSAGNGQSHTIGVNYLMTLPAYRFLCYGHSRLRPAYPLKKVVPADERQSAGWVRNLRNLRQVQTKDLCRCGSRPQLSRPTGGDPRRAGSHPRTAALSDSRNPSGQRHANEPTICCGDTAGKARSRCRGRGRGLIGRTTTPGWNSGTGRMCARWSKVVEYRRMNTIGESCRFRASCMRVSRCTRKALEAGSPIPVAAVQEKPAA